MSAITATYMSLCQNLWQHFLSLCKIYITNIRKERFPPGKPKVVWKAPLRCHISFKFFISLRVTNSHLFLFRFVWQFLYRFITQNLMDTFRWVFVDVYTIVLVLKM